MVQIYKRENNDYEANGDIVIFPEECILTAILNGTWVLELTHPLDDEGRWKYIDEESVICVPTFQGKRQLFRVGEVEKTDTEVSATAYPIFFDSKDDCFLIDVRPELKTGKQALDIMTGGTKYTGESDITRGATAYFVRRNLMDAINGQDEPTFIQRWGGEILYDNHKVIINERVGGDYGVEIRYGKNMDGILYHVDLSEVATRIVPVSYNGYTLEGPEPWVDSQNIRNYAKVYTKEMKFENVKLRSDTNEEDETNGTIICDTLATLRKALQEESKNQFARGVDKPKVTIEIDMVDLSQMEEYKDYKILETVSLGDTVHCRHSKLDITTDARVVEIVWDCIRDIPAGMKLGDFEYNYFNDITSTMDRADSAIGQDGMLIAERIKGIINGINASLQIQSSVAKKVNGRAFLIEDTDEESELYGAMEAGTQGMRIAKERTQDKKDWKWNTAITSKGIIADAIITGLLADKNGRSYWNLDTGEMVVDGKIKSSSAEINGGTFKVETNDAYDARIQIGSTTVGGQKNKMDISPIRLLSKTTSDKKCVMVSGAIGVVVGKYSGTLTNEGTITTESSIVGGFISCQQLQQSSDRRIKKNITEIRDDTAEKLLKGLKPVEFEFKEGDKKKHFGFVAQDVGNILESDEYGIVIEAEDTEDTHKCMRIAYTELIAPIYKILQRQEKEIKAMRELIERRLK